MDHKEIRSLLYPALTGHTCYRQYPPHTIMTSAALERTPLQIVVKNSIDTWRNDLKDLLKHAKDRFPDVMWEYDDYAESSDGIKRQLWGHKGVLVAVCICITWRC